jgi:hypothetical protein
MQANRGVIMYMKDWIARLDAFLQFNEQAILQDAGKVSHEVALALAETEFDKYSQKQDALYESDFDKAVQTNKSIEQAEDDLDKAMQKLQNKKKK